MPMIDRQVIDEILARTDMQSLVGSYVALKRSGSNMTGLCPFHSEKSPSFTVFTADASFYCFGCGVGGNAITFIRKVENLDFPDAVELLARRAGITLHLEDRDAGPRINRKRFYEMNRVAARFFHKQLYEDNEGARQALAYFTEKRGLPSAAIKHFGLGYAPDDFNSFTDHMRRAGYTEDELIMGYLAARTAKGFLRPAFRNRVMFPILDVSENVIAFGGRVMEKAEPKYLNSSDTPVYKKGSHLFALNFAHKTSAEQIILCEGYMDAIALHVAGFTNTVAGLGTAIRPEQARLLSRYTKSVVLCYDSDEAGRKAAERALSVLEETGLEVKVILLPDAKDPDEYINKFGADAFKSLLAASASKFEFNFSRILRKYNLSVPQEKIAALDELCDMVAGVYSSVEREIYINEIAKRLSVAAVSVSKDVERKLYAKRSGQKRQQTEQAHRIISGYGDGVNADFVRMPRIAKAEESVLGLLQLYPEHRKRVFAEPPLLTEADFGTELGKRIFAFIRDAEAENGFYPEMLDASFSADEVGRITRMRVERMTLSDNGDAVLSECIASLKAAVAEENSKNAPATLEGLDALLRKKRMES